jgi:hypothetical protein
VPRTQAPKLSTEGKGLAVGDSLRVAGVEAALCLAAEVEVDLQGAGEEALHTLGRDAKVLRPQGQAADWVEAAAGLSGSCSVLLRTVLGPRASTQNILVAQDDCTDWAHTSAIVKHGILWIVLKSKPGRDMTTNR